MRIINSGTNTAVSGYRVPQGAYEWPVHGSITLWGGAATNGWTNTLTCTSGSTVIADDLGATVVDGYGALEGIIFGFCLGLALFWTLGGGRWLARQLVRAGGASPGDI